MSKEPQSPGGATLPGLHQKPDEGRARILIVEDDYFVAMTLEQDLTNAGFEVVGIAITAEEALDLAALHRPALAVMDIRLAGAKDGIDAAIELKSRFGIASVFATAHGDAATRARAKTAEPLGWLIKPYSSKSVVETVRAALSHAEYR